MDYPKHNISDSADFYSLTVDEKRLIKMSKDIVASRADKIVDNDNDCVDIELSGDHEEMYGFLKKVNDESDELTLRKNEITFSAHSSFYNVNKLPSINETIDLSDTIDFDFTDGDTYLKQYYSDLEKINLLRNMNSDYNQPPTFGSNQPEKEYIPNLTRREIIDEYGELNASIEKDVRKLIDTQYEKCEILGNTDYFRSSEYDAICLENRDNNNAETDITNYLEDTESNLLIFSHKTTTNKKINEAKYNSGSSSTGALSTKTDRTASNQRAFSQYDTSKYSIDKDNIFALNNSIIKKKSAGRIQENEHVTLMELPQGTRSVTAANNEISTSKLLLDCKNIHSTLHERKSRFNSAPEDEVADVKDFHNLDVLRRDEETYALRRKHIEMQEFVSDAEILNQKLKTERDLLLEDLKKYKKTLLEKLAEMKSSIKTEYALEDQNTNLKKTIDELKIEIDKLKQELIEKILVANTAKRELSNSEIALTRISKAFDNVRSEARDLTEKIAESENSVWDLRKQWKNFVCSVANQFKEKTADIVPKHLY